jgi:hypothetical protein
MMSRGSCARAREQRQAPAAPSSLRGPTPASAPAAGGPHAQLLHLQRTIGNRATRRWLQAKLTVSQPGDPYEREADQVAEQVLRMPDAAAGGVEVSSATSGGVQRLCQECEEQLQRKADAEEETSVVQAEREPGGNLAGDGAVGAEIAALPHSGEALPEAARSYFEPRFGRDFGHVRVHRNGSSAALARSLHARAFTVGSDIVFGTGEYAPQTQAGRRLLAHELTHVVQQSAGAGLTSSSSAALGQSGAVKSGAGSAAQVYRAPQAGLIQRDAAGVAETALDVLDPKRLLGKLWLSLDRGTKLKFVDRAISAALKTVDEFPGRLLLGEIWTFLKEGLIGLYTRLGAAKDEVKILVLDKIASIIAGKSEAYSKALLIGLVKGFFIDGALGIFIGIWELVKGLGSLWNFIKQVGDAISGFPEDIQNLIQGFQNIGQDIAANIGPAIAELIKVVGDPQQASGFLAGIVETGKTYAKQAGEKVADGLLGFFSKPGAEAELGETTGRLVGMGLWEALFAVLTAGGGVAVTAAKEGLGVATKFLAKIAGKITGAFIRLFEEARAIFGTIAKFVKEAVGFVKGKLKDIGGKLGKLFDDVVGFFAKLLGNCHESKLTCKLKAAKRLLRWSSKRVEEAASALQRGIKEVTVRGRDEAGELFLGIFHGKGFTNTTGMTGKQVRQAFPGGKRGTFHWDLLDTQHGGRPHLQVHDEAGSIFRIFF